MWLYELYIIYTETRKKYFGFYHKMRTPASKSAAMLTKIMATRYVCFVTYFLYVHLLSYTCKLSQSSLKLRYHIDNNLFLQYRMSTGLDFSTQSPCCGWRRKKTHVNHCYEFWQCWRRIKSITIRNKQFTEVHTPWCIGWLVQIQRNVFKMATWQLLARIGVYSMYTCTCISFFLNAHYERIMQWKNL